MKPPRELQVFIDYAKKHPVKVLILLIMLVIIFIGRVQMNSHDRPARTSIRTAGVDTGK